MRYLLALLILFCILVFPAHGQDRLVLVGPNDPVNQVSTLILSAAYAKLGISIRVQHPPAARTASFATQGMSDGLVNRIEGIDKNFPSLIRITVPINFVEGFVYTKDSNVKVTDWQSLAPYRIGVRIGTLFIERHTHGMDRTSVISNEALFQMLHKDRIQIALTSGLEGLSVIKRLNLTGITRVEPSLTRALLFHYLRQENKHLIPHITAVLEQMQQSGEIDAIRQSAIAQLLKS